MKLTRGEFVGLAYANDDELREFVEELLAENAKLRELVRAIVCATDPHDRERLVINAAELLGEVDA